VAVAKTRGRFASDREASMIPIDPSATGRVETVTDVFEVGFCGGCGIVREEVRLEDGARAFITDCVCTAKLRHDADCFYVKCVSSPIDTGIYCSHGLHACEEHDCDCKGKKDGNQEQPGEI
jgi:hypothetical protein